MADAGQWTDFLAEAGSALVSSPPAECEWALGNEEHTRTFLEQCATERDMHRKETKENNPGSGTKRKRKTSADHNRLPLYNLKQVMTWVDECDTKNQERERSRVSRLLVEIYMRLLPKLKRRPTANCNCSSCVTYKERVKAEALHLGWSVTLSPRDMIPYCPQLGEEHLVQD